MKITATNFKTKCLRIMDQVNEYHEEVIITKHGKPIAKLLPISTEPGKTLYGFMKNSVKIKGDITIPLEDKWNAENE